MQVSVERVSSVERRLTITVPADQVEKAYNQHIVQYAKKANIKGFRPGKAPISYIKRQFSNDAWQAAWGEVIQKSLYEAIANNSLHPINTPTVEPKTMLPNQPLEYIALFEVLPEFDTIQATIESVERLRAEVTAEDIDEVIQKLRKQSAKWQIVEREAQTTDRVVIDYYSVFEGQEDKEHKVHDFSLELGSKIMLPGFEDGLLGAKVGDERILHLCFPENFTIRSHAGKAVDFIVTIKQIYEGDIPVLNEPFIQKLGIASGNEHDLKAQVQQTLEQGRDHIVKEKLKNQIFNNLIEHNPIEVPKSLVEREAKRIHDEVYKEDHHHAQQHSEKEMTSFNEIANKRVTIGLLIREYARQKKITVDKEQIQKRIATIATSYQHPQEVIAWLSSKERIGDIEAQVLEDQVIDQLLEGVNVVEKVMSYTELKRLE